MSGPDRPHALRLLIAWAVLSVVGVFISMQVHLPPGDQSTQATDETSLLQLMLIISTPVFIGVVLFILYSVFAFRQPRGAALEDGPPSHGNFRLQVAWVAITAVIVLILAVIGINGLTSSAATTTFASGQAALGTSSSASASGNRLQVQVIGQQWWFTYRYPDFGGVESAHLMLPVDTNIEFHVTSTDVLHSFWAYQLGIKADANPGADNITYVSTVRTGSFTVRCAELCGIWHGHMADTNGAVVSQADFTAWVTQQQKDDSDIKLPPYSPIYFPHPPVKGS
ncbi:MAG: cytochrome c oxidase subunit [Chloroflexota bacterium]|nr:cytochrome c oxidase subunit [Chloroflexota bacterium]